VVAVAAAFLGLALRDGNVGPVLFHSLLLLLSLRAFLAARGLRNAIALAERDEESHAELLKKARAQLEVVKQKLAELRQAGGKKGRPARRR